MADKMMRMAGRGEDGTAKAIKVDNYGNTLSKKSRRYVLRQIYPSDQYQAPKGGSWETLVYSTDDRDWLDFRFVSSSTVQRDYKIELIELISGVTVRTVEVVGRTDKSIMIGSARLRAGLDFKIKVTNYASAPLGIGFIVTLR